MPLGSGDRYLNHLYTIKKWHAKQERIQIAESNTPTAHLMNSSPNRSINIFMTPFSEGKNLTGKPDVLYSQTSSRPKGLLVIIYAIELRLFYARSAIVYAPRAERVSGQK